MAAEATVTVAIAVVAVETVDAGMAAEDAAGRVDAAMHRRLRCR